MGTSFVESAIRVALKTLSPRHLSDTAATLVFHPYRYPYRPSSESLPLNP